MLDLASGSLTANIIALNTRTTPQAGAVYGTLFRSGASASKPGRVTKLDLDASAELVRTNGRSLCTDYWGSYAAFIRSPAGLTIISDPSGTLPCHYAERDGLTLVFSHLEKCAFIDPAMFSVNETFVRRLLVYDKIQNGETGLNEVRELAAGERLRINGRERRRDRIWDPRTFGRRPLALSANDAADRMRQTCQTVIAAWASCFDEVSVSVSGGLDSAIVLSCLAHAGLPIRARAFHNLLRSGDAPELAYALEAAEQVRLPISVIRSSPPEALPDVEAHPASVRPFRSFLAPPMASPFGMLADNPERSAIFTGQGGDHLFLARRTPLTFADHLHRQPLSGQFIQELLNASRLASLSVWKTAAASARSLIGNPASAVDAAVLYRQAKLAGLSLHQTDMRRSYPDWALDGKGIAPLKFLQISSLAHLQQARDRLAETVPWTVIDPIISQPLIEFCLQVPCEILCAGGISRGLARQAFSQHIPDSIRSRMSKGSASSYFGAYFANNRHELFEALMHGELARRGLLSPSDCRFLTDMPGLGLQKFGRTLLIWYAIEAWLRTWNRAGSRYGVSS